MKYTFVIDDDVKSFEEIKEAVGLIDAQMEYRRYESLEAFALWIRTMVEQSRKKSAPADASTDIATPAPGAAASATPVAAPAAAPIAATTAVANTAPTGTDSATAPNSPSAAAPAAEAEPENIELRLVVIKSEFLKHKGFSLLQKIREYFINRGICTREEPTAFVVTAFEEESFDYGKYENQIVSNILFKPFDKLILQSHLRVALAGAKIEKGGDLYVQKTTSLKIEMLKEAPMIELFETGFATISDREFPVGSVAKYYGSIFQSGRYSSVYAKLRKIEKIAESQWRCDFVYFNIQPAQSSIVRRTIKSEKKYHRRSISCKAKPGVAKTHNFLFLSPKDVPTLEDSLKDSFQNINTVVYNDYLNFLYEIDPLETLSGGGKSAEKPLPFSQGKVYLDQKFSKILLFDPAPGDTATFLGQGAKAAVDKEPQFINRIHSDDKNRWVELVKKQLPAGQKSQVFRFRAGEDSLGFITVLKLVPFKHPKLGDVLELELALTTDADKKSFLQTLSRIPSHVDAIFLDRIFLGENPALRWRPILDLIKDKAGPQGLKLFVLTGQELKSEDLIEKQAPIEDVFTRPFDSPSATRRLLLEFPGLLPREDVEIAHRDFTEVLKVAQAVPAEQVSESGLAIRYSRAIPVGQFRKVVLWMPHEIGLPEFLVSCFGVEEVEEDKEKFWICHFIFFGVRDTSLKHIRRWLKEYYVTHKAAE